MFGATLIGARLLSLVYPIEMVHAVLLGFALTLALRHSVLLATCDNRHPRALAVTVLLLTLINPSLVEEQRDPQKDVALIVADESPSQRIGERARYTEAALGHLTEQLEKLKDLEPVADVRTKPEEGAPLAFSVAQNVVMELLEPGQSGWLRVRYADGSTGFVRASLVWGG